MMHFVYRPTGEAARIIKVILLVQMDRNELTVERILPNMNNALILQYGDRCSYSLDGIEFTELPECYFALAAASRNGIYWKNDGVNKSLMVIFNPGIMYSAFGFPLGETQSELFVPPEIILGKSGQQFCKRVIDPEINNNQRIALCEEYFSRFCRNPENDALSYQAVQKIITDFGLLNITRLTEYFHTTKRTLNRKFIAEQGISPYAYARIVRCHTALDLIRTQQYGWQDIIYRLHYFDQAHFIHDFKALSGYAPGQYMKKDFKMEKLIRDSWDS